MRDTILEIKNRIKYHASMQRLTKLLRKQPENVPNYSEVVDILIDDKFFTEDMRYDAACAVRCRKDLISALLDFYHEIRGSDYRHISLEKVKSTGRWFYKQNLDLLRKEFGIEDD